MTAVEQVITYKTYICAALGKKLFFNVNNIIHVIIIFFFLKSFIIYLQYTGILKINTMSKFDIYV